MTVFNQW